MLQNVIVSRPTRQETLPIRRSPSSSLIVTRVNQIWQNLTIEPAMFLIAFTYSMSGSTGSQLLIYKSCRVDFNETDETCHNLFLPENKPLNDAITDKASFHSNEFIFFPIVNTLLYDFILRSKP